MTSIITISIIASNDREIKYRMTQQVIEQVYSEEGKINFYSQTHEKFFISSYRMFNDNKILGIGTKLYREACALDSYAYNNSCLHTSITIIYNYLLKLELPEQLCDYSILTLNLLFNEIASEK